MSVVNRNANLKEIDGGIKNKFRWNWLEEKDSLGDFLSNYIRKIDICGQCLCLICNDRIRYGTCGKKDLIGHSKSKKHEKNAKARKNTQSFPAMFFLSNDVDCTNNTATNPANGDGSCNIPYGAPPNVHAEALCPAMVKPETSNVNFQDRKSNQEAMIISFLAEHSLPFTMAPELLNLAKELGRDPKALDSIKMSRQSATYKLKHGLDLVLHKKLVTELQKTPFSINLDECTASNNEKVLSILTSHFSEQQQECVVHHYASVSMTVVNSETVFTALIDLLEKDNIPLENLISSLSDSANYMRGKVSGFETRLREKAPHLLDIDGDICHHVHNITKKFCGYFDHVVESLADDLHTDFKYSPDLKSFLQEICVIFGCAFHVPPQRVPHRWLSVYDVTVTNYGLFDVLTLFYFVWVDSDVKECYKELYFKLLGNLSKESRKRIIEISGCLRKKNLTKDGLARKKRIVEKLFYKRDTTQLIISLYLSVLPLFKSFVLTFECKEPMAHRLHEELLSVAKSFYCCFIKHEKVKDLNAKKVLELDLGNVSNQLPLSQIYVGSEAETLITNMEDTEVKAFLEKVMNSYVDAGKYMQSKFPLDNRLLRYLAAVDPKAQGHSVTHGALKKLSSFFPTILPDDEKEQYLKDVSNIQIDSNLPDPDMIQRLDLWWAPIFGRYQALGKVVKAVLCIFAGPRVEQSFSVMNDIINPKTNRMNISTFSSIQSVKYDLKSKHTTSLELYHREDKFKSPVDPRVCYHLQTAYGRYNRKRKAKNEEKTKTKKKMNIEIKDKKLSKKSLTVHSVAAKQKKRIVDRNQYFRPKKKRRI